MSASHPPGMWPDSWRHEPYCYADEHTRVFTVANCPPIIQPIATAPDDELLVNRQLGSQMQPQFSRNKYPELSFVLRKLPVADPLLSRLGADASQFRAIRYEGGWAMADDIRKAWIALEKGLLHISELLMTSSDQSSVGTSARYAIRNHEHCPPPQDHGYRILHASAEDAERSIKRAHAAFQILAARCSLAIALWEFPGPLHGQIPSISTARYDPVTTSVVLDWVMFLRLFDPTDCPWLPIAPVLRAANVPVFFFWRSPMARNKCLEEHPYLTSFVPPATTDVYLALDNLPRGQPRLVTLCRDGTTRLHPDYTSFDHSTPPFGPYQLPGESRKEFLARRERYRPDQQRQELLLQMGRRHTREAHAETGHPPNRRTQVYLWVRSALVFPDVKPEWACEDYRHPIPPPAYKSLWMIHPPNLRLYNSFYDEWDLWFPDSWSASMPGEGPEGRGVIRSSPESFGETLSPMEHFKTSPADDLLMGGIGPEDRDIRDMSHADNFILHSWYGIQFVDLKPLSGIDYTKWSQDLWHLLGETRDSFLPDDDSRRALAGWAGAVMDRDWKSRALQSTWDLDLRHPNYVLGAGSHDPWDFVRIERVRTPQRADHPDNGQIWVLMKFLRDGEDIAWTLITTPMGAMLLMRRLPEAVTSADALHTLLCAGIPARTATWLAVPPHEGITSKPILRPRRLRAPWREKGERPTIEDYDVYCLRVLELCQSPHARAAWLMGGIVWRILVEITGKDARAHLCVTHLQELQNGPSGLMEHYQAISLDGDQGGYYDDSLTTSELDIIAGVIRVYTGRGDQTEDASWWPKHSAWVRAAGYTGIWSAADERWFQRRLAAIFEQKESPLNAAEWKTKLKRQRKAGSLAKRVEQRTWELTYRHFVQEVETASFEVAS